MARRMTSDRKKPGVAFWATVVVVAVLIGYPLSAGPIAYLETRDLLPSQVTKVIELFYWPLNWIFDHSPESVREAMWSYSKLWIPEDHPIRQMQPGDTW
jgi:hypothetical protein